MATARGALTIREQRQLADASAEAAKVNERERSANFRGLAASITAAHTATATGPSAQRPWSR